MENFQKIAVLIDADNTQLTKLEAVLHEVSTYGRIVVKKAYGNWRKDSLKNWESELKRLAIRAEQQFDYVTGKNTTDIAMVIGAMDLLHTNMYDALVLVSSDSDFTPLAIRLRESGLYIIGAGVTTTPESFKNACDDFILIDYLAKADDKPAVEHTAEPAAKSPQRARRKRPPAARKSPPPSPHRPPSRSRHRPPNPNRRRKSQTSARSTTCCTSPPRSIRTPTALSTSAPRGCTSSASSPTSTSAPTATASCRSCWQPSRTSTRSSATRVRAARRSSPINACNIEH